VLATLSEIDLTSQAGAPKAEIKLGSVHNIVYGISGGTDQ